LVGRLLGGENGVEDWGPGRLLVLVAKHDPGPDAEPDPSPDDEHDPGPDAEPDPGPDDEHDPGPDAEPYTGPAAEPWAGTRGAAWAAWAPRAPWAARTWQVKARVVWGPPAWVRFPCQRGPTVG